MEARESCAQGAADGMMVPPGSRESIGIGILVGLRTVSTMVRGTASEIGKL